MLKFHADLQESSSQVSSSKQQAGGRGEREIVSKTSEVIGERNQNKERVYKNESG
jgi:hypothetical protein